jgi:hypothetical protein
MSPGLRDEKRRAVGRPIVHGTKREVRDVKNDDDFIVTIFTWLAHAAGFVIAQILTVLFFLLGLLSLELGRLSRWVAGKQGRSLEVAPLRPDILKAVMRLEYAGRKRFTTVLGNPNGYATGPGSLTAVGETLRDDEEVVTVRVAFTDESMQRLDGGLRHSNPGVLALTTRRLLFVGIRGGAELPCEAIDTAQSGVSGLFARQSSVTVQSQGGYMIFGLEGQWHGGADMARWIMTVRNSSELKASPGPPVAASETAVR